MVPLIILGSLHVGGCSEFHGFWFGISSCRRMWDDFSRFFSIENAGESNWIQHREVLDFSMKYSLHLGYVSQHLIWSLIWAIFRGFSQLELSRCHWFPFSFNSSRRESRRINGFQLFGHERLCRKIARNLRMLQDSGPGVEKRWTNETNVHVVSRSDRIAEELQGLQPGSS